MKLRLFLILFFIIFSLSNAQEFDPQKLESILEIISIESGSSPEIEDIERFIENPIQIKDASINRILLIPGFTSLEAKKIHSIVSSDSIQSIEDLFNEIKLSPDQQYLLRVCTTFEKSDDKKDKNYVYYRARNKQYLNKIRGFEQGKFLGDKIDFYQRLIAYNNKYNISFGVLTDKDGGERIENINSSIYLIGEVNGFKYALGDYYIETGMGSILWKAFPFRKGSEVIYPAVVKGRGLMPYRSSIDNGFFRGCAGEYSFSLFGSELKTTLWYSNVKRSGTIDSSGNYVTSVYTSGYYRTENEIEKYKSFREIAFGSNIEWKYDLFTLGLNGLSLNNSKKIISESKGAFYGKNGTLYSLYSYLNLDFITVGTELGYDARGNPALRIGSQITLGDFEIANNLRSYTDGFRSPLGANFGEGSYPNNEYGFYTGIRYKGFDNFILSGYADIYASYGETYYVPEPIKGIDLFFQTEMNLGHKSNLYFRIKNESKTDAKRNAEDVKKVFMKNQIKSRVELKHEISKNLNLRIRGELTYVDLKSVVPDESGYLAFAEMKWDATECLMSGIRLTYFNTDSYESAIWQFEWAMPGSMYTIPLYGNGMRFYAYTRFGISDFIDFWFRYMITWKKAAESLGSGYLEIYGDKDQRYILQLDLKL
jgi:hypothetical protein